MTENGRFGAVNVSLPPAKFTPFDVKTVCVKSIKTLRFWKEVVIERVKGVGWGLHGTEVLVARLVRANPKLARVTSFWFAFWSLINQPELSSQETQYYKVTKESIVISTTALFRQWYETQLRDDRYNLATLPSFQIRPKQHLLSSVDFS